MNYKDRLGVPSAPSEPVSSAQGIIMLEERIGMAFEKTAHIHSMLMKLEERMYATKPHTLNDAATGGAIPGSLENGINMLNSSLNAIQNLTQRILEG